MRESTRRHQAMTQSQILSDLKKQVTLNAKQLNEHGKSLDPDMIMRPLSGLDKETLIALEQARLQTLMSSGNYVFWLTRKDISGMGGDYGEVIQSRSNLAIFMFPLAMVLDIALFPVEFLLTAVTGF